MKLYKFRKMSDDFIITEFYKRFPSAYLADIWATKVYKLWMQGKISFRIIFLAGEEITV